MYEIERVWQFKDEEGEAQVTYSFNYDNESEDYTIALKSWSFDDVVYGQKDSTTEKEDKSELIKYLVYLYMVHRTSFDENEKEREYLFKALDISYESLWEMGVQIVPKLELSKVAFRLPDGQKIWQYYNEFFLENLNNVVMWLPDGYDQVV
jgi:hypothetical protein